jgi:hypothetical protein
LSEDKKAKGILHFFFDSNNQIQYVSQDEYEAKKETLPDLCFAIKAPITDVEKL